MIRPLSQVSELYQKRAIGVDSANARREDSNARTFSICNVGQT